MSTNVVPRIQNGIFLGSTNDSVTKGYRQAARAIIEQEFADEWYPVEMDAFRPDTPPPAQTCKQKVLSCATYVGILGPFYGSICDEARMSYTQYEYTVAKEAHNIKIGMFLLPERLIKEAESHVIIQQAPLVQRQEAFRATVGKETTTKEVMDLENFKEEFRLFMHSLRKSNTYGSGPLVPFIGPGDVYDRRKVLWYGLNDLDPNQFQALLSAIEKQTSLGEFPSTSSNVQPEERLAALGLMTDGKPTLGLFLCIAPNVLIADKFASSSLHMVEYSGSQRGSSRTLHMQEIQANLVDLYSIGMNYFYAQLSRRGEPGSDVRDDLEIPFIALREGLTNALMHRDYEHKDTRDQPTRIEIYTDRVEITSFGGLMNGVSETELNEDPEAIIPRRRNPVIARIFLDLALAEMNGGGVARMQQAAIQAGLPKPKISEDMGNPPSVKLVLYRPRVRKLPPDEYRFVGRDNELHWLREELRRAPGQRFALVVTGMSGVGKSALAARAVSMVAEDPHAFPGGIVWVRCDGRMGLSGVAWIEDQLLTAFDAVLSPRGLTLTHDATSEQELEVRERALAARLRPTAGGSNPAPVLVFLDNVEHDLPLERIVDTLIPLSVTVLLTSRYEPSLQRLRIQRLDVLDPESAVEFFATRYADRGGVWNPERDTSAALQIVQALGRLPLAIEVAAARAARTRRDLTTLAEEFGQPDVLSHLNDPLDSAASVRFALARSLDMLDSTQRVRFAALGLPDGSDWARPLIERLLAAVPIIRAHTTSAANDLDTLVALSLISIFTPEPLGTSEARVRLHPLLRELARQEWMQQAPATRLAGLTSLLAAVDELVLEHRRDFATLEREEDLIAGTLRAAANEYVSPWQLSGIIDNLTSYLYTGGHWRLGIALFTLQLTIRQRLNDRPGEAATLNTLGYLSESMGRLQDAEHYFAQALPIWRAIGNRAGEGDTLSGLGTLAVALGQTDEATRYFQQALAIRREVSNRGGEAANLNDLGALAASLGTIDEATGYYEQALAISSEVDDKPTQGATLNNLGSLARSLGHIESATQYFGQALAIRREIGDRAGEAATLNNLGSLAASSANIDEATGYYEQALSIFEAIGTEKTENSARVVRDNLAALGTPRTAALSKLANSASEVASDSEQSTKEQAPNPKSTLPVPPVPEISPPAHKARRRTWKIWQWWKSS